MMLQGALSLRMSSPSPSTTRYIKTPALLNPSNQLPINLKEKTKTKVHEKSWKKELPYLLYLGKCEIWNCPQFQSHQMKNGESG